MPLSQDLEDRAGAGECTPMLGSSSHQWKPGGQSRDDKSWNILHVLRFLGGGIYAPDPTTYDPIEILLNTEDEKERDELTLRWRDNKLSELSFVGVVVCIHHRESGRRDL